MKPAQVIQVSRDAGGIRYEGETPQLQAERPTPKPIRVPSKKAAEKLGWRVTGQPEHVREVPGTSYLEKIAGSYQAEWVGSFRGGPPMAHRQYATTLRGLLKAIESFEQRKAGGT